jgi:hypothetical protein
MSGSDEEKFIEIVIEEPTRTITDKIPTADLEALQRDMVNLDGDDEGWDDSIFDPVRKDTSPVPPAILRFNQRAAEALGSFDADSYADTQTRIKIEELNICLLEELDRLVEKSADQEEIYTAIHREMDKTADSEVRKNIWDLCMHYLCVVIKENYAELLKELQERGTLNHLYLNGKIRKIMKLIVSQSVRRTFLYECKKLIDNLSLPSHKDDVVQALVASTSQLLNQDMEREPRSFIHRSATVAKAFTNAHVPLPPESTVTPHVFLSSYPGHHLDLKGQKFKLYKFFQKHKEQHPQAAEALGILHQTQKLGIVIGDAPDVDIETFQQQCSVYYKEITRLSTGCNDSSMKTAIGLLWRNIIAPQLALYGEFLYSSFLLPDTQ